jgi:hypothetical protein
MCSSCAEPVVRATLLDGSQLLLDARSRTESGPLWTGVYDEDEVTFLSGCLGAEAVFVDIGANVGLITIPVCRAVQP